VEESLTQFIYSDTGYWVALVLVFVGLTDFAFAYLALRHFPEWLGEAEPQIRQISPILFFMAGFMVLLGGYMLWLRL
jgi:hypothetical protein